MKTRLPNLVGKSLLLLLICASFLRTSYSQSLLLGNDKFKVEAGVNFGPSFFFGDLGGNRGKGATIFLKDLNLGLTKMMKGAFITVYPASWIGFRVAAQAA